MKISIIICTHNRAKSLKRTLSSVIRQTLLKTDYEIIVVDNASTDNTKDITESFGVQYIYEQKLGLSTARNTGWKAAKGINVAFLDDDATVTEVWLEKLLDGFARSEATHTCVGGMITLFFPFKRPEWIHDDLMFCLGLLDCGGNIKVQSDTSFFLHGCNMSFKKSTLEYFGGFKETVGRDGTSLLSGEDVLLQMLIVRGGGTLCYHPEAVAVHHISPERLEKRWFIKRMYWEGISTVRIEREVGDEIQTISELRLLFREVVNRVFIFSPSFDKFCFASRRLGRIRESLRKVD